MKTKFLSFALSPFIIISAPGCGSDKPQCENLQGIASRSLQTGLSQPTTTPKVVPTPKQPTTTTATSSSSAPSAQTGSGCDTGTKQGECTADFFNPNCTASGG